MGIRGIVTEGNSNGLMLPVPRKVNTALWFAASACRQPHRTDCGNVRVPETADIQLVPGLLSSPHSHAAIPMLPPISRTLLNNDPWLSDWWSLAPSPVCVTPDSFRDKCHVMSTFLETAFPCSEGRQASPLGSTVHGRVVGSSPVSALRQTEWYSLSVSQDGADRKLVKPLTIVAPLCIVRKSPKTGEGRKRWCVGYLGMDSMGMVIPQRALYRWIPRIAQSDGETGQGK